MKQLTENIFVGTINDYYGISVNGWAVVHACKDPSHKELVGYTGNLNPSHPNYSLKESGDRLALNIVDIDFFSENYEEHHANMLKYTLDFINRKIKEGKKVLIHCNLGESRSPSIAMLYLASIGTFDYKSFEETETEFKNLYSSYNPKKNIRENVRRVWTDVVNNRS